MVFSGTAFSFALGVNEISLSDKQTCSNNYGLIDGGYIVSRGGGSIYEIKFKLNSSGVSRNYILFISPNKCYFKMKLFDFSQVIGNN